VQFLSKQKKNNLKFKIKINFDIRMFIMPLKEERSTVFDFKSIKFQALKLYINFNKCKLLLVRRLFRIEEKEDK
jgi:hypothetical protein